MMSNQQQTYQGVVGVQQAQPPGLLNSQRNNMGGQMQSVMGVQQAQPPGLLSSQRSGMGSQMQGLMVQYTPLPSYQVGICCSPAWGAGRGPRLGRMCPRDGARGGDLLPGRACQPGEGTSMWGSVGHIWSRRTGRISGRGCKKKTTWNLFTLLVSPWASFPCSVTCYLLLSSLPRFPWPVSPRTWSSSPSSSQCLCQPASLCRGGSRLEGSPSTTVSSPLPSRMAPGKAQAALASLGEKGVLCPQWGFWGCPVKAGSQP